ncbi:unnamed protein product [Lactuca saligna]|uniref:Protein CHUP1, chloroplastic n=1 Tax=Lactuca saligna TaxID=75948 RepID=A0AA35V325_LACSI|nr:unnamed protein product [Lactuca saligna]
MGRGTREINPDFLKIGLAVAFSLGGMLFTFIRNKRIKPSKSPSDPSKSPGNESGGSKTIGRHASHTRHFDPLATTDKHILQDELHDSGLNPQKDTYLLPEFIDLVKEFDTTSMKTNTELPNPRVIKDNNEQEIKNLRNMVKTLKEREKNLEIQLLEYYGLKEQETAVMELQNRLKLNTMEAKLFNLKIESLQTENKRLEAQMADYRKVLADLEAAKAKIKVLKSKLRVETAQNKERILNLQQRVEKMQDDEHEGVVGIDPDVQLKLCKLKDLEDEAEELRKSNYSLQIEKSELAERLENVQILATAVLEDEETERLKQERERLKQQNEDLSKEIEQLQADRCGDVEELVYLRWINACLRHELRNHQPGPGKTMARDLSKTLSPKSEEKAKQLILEYANKEGIGDNGINILVPELDSDQWSSSQASILTDSGDLDESLIDDSSSRKTHNRFFGKLMKLLRGKDSHSPNHLPHPHHHNRHVSHSRNSSVEDMNSYSDSSFGHLGSSFKHSVDSQKSINRHSDVGGWMCSDRRIDSIAEGEGIGGAGGDSSDTPSSSDGKRSELVKYAEVLRDSNPTRFHRRSAQFSSF